MNANSIKNISIAAGLTNIVGVLFFSLGFTNQYISFYYPAVFSTFGLVAIILWGFAYIAAVFGEPNKYIFGVFALEKLLYVVTWGVWMTAYVSQLGHLYDQSFLTGLFYTLYGPIDFVFGVCFAFIALRLRKTS